MGTSGSGTNRRPLKSRSTRWAGIASRMILSTSLSANQVSFLGIVIAALGAWALVESPTRPWFFLAAAACIQLRLLANMLDGMVAVEGGRQTPAGALYNEVPDRLADSIFIVALGVVIGEPWLGWLGALLAALTAYIRTLGGALGLAQDFRGPMAKPPETTDE